MVLMYLVIVSSLWTEIYSQKVRVLRPGRAHTYRFILTHILPFMIRTRTVNQESCGLFPRILWGHKG